MDQETKPLDRRTEETVESSVPLEDPSEELGPDAERPAVPDAIGFSGFRKLDPQAVKLWKIEGVLGLGWILPAGLIGGTLLWTFGEVPLWAILPAWGLILCLQWIFIWWFPPRQYQCWSYRLDERVLELCHGVFWQASVMIPMSRVQHIDVNHGPLERRFGLATLVIHTAGTQHAKHEVPHLEAATALQLRERLAEAVGLPVQ